MFRTGKRHKLTSEAGKRNERGVDPTICEVAADRVAELLDDVRRRHGRAGRHRRRHAAARRRRSRSPCDLPGAGRRHADRRATASSTHLRRDRLRRVAATTDARPSTAAAVAPRPHRPLRPGRGGRPASSATTRCRRCCPTPPAGRGLTREQRLRRRIGRTLAGAGLRRGGQLPVRRRRRPSTRSGCPPTTCCAHAVRLSNPLSQREAALHHDAAARACSTRPPATSGAAPPGVALFETGTVAFPRRPRPGARSTASTGGPTEAELAKLLRRRCPAQPLHLARRSLAGEREPAGWWGDGPRRPTGPTRSRSSARVGRRARRRGRGRGRRADAVAPEPLRRVLGRRRGARPRRRAAPRGSARRSACPRGTAAARDRPRRADGARRSTSAGAGVLAPSRWPRRTSRSSSTPRSRPPTSRPRCARAPASCSSRSGSSTSTPAPQVGEGRKSLAFALRFRAPDRTLTEGETGAARDAAVASRPSAPAPSSAPDPPSPRRVPARHWPLSLWRLKGQCACCRRSAPLARTTDLGDAAVPILLAVGPVPPDPPSRMSSPLPPSRRSRPAPPSTTSLRHRCPGPGRRQARPRAGPRGAHRGAGVVPGTTSDHRGSRVAAGARRAEVVRTSSPPRPSRRPACAPRHLDMSGPLLPTTSTASADHDRLLPERPRSSRRSWTVARRRTSQLLRGPEPDHRRGCTSHRRAASPRPAPPTIDPLAESQRYEPVVAAAQVDVQAPVGSQGHAAAAVVGPDLGLRGDALVRARCR